MAALGRYPGSGAASPGHHGMGGAQPANIILLLL